MKYFFILLLVFIDLKTVRLDNAVSNHSVSDHDLDGELLSAAKNGNFYHSERVKLKL